MVLCLSDGAGLGGGGGGAVCLSAVWESRGGGGGLLWAGGLMLVCGRVGAGGVGDLNTGTCCRVTLMHVPHFLSIISCPVTVAIFAPKTITAKIKFKFVGFHLVLDPCRRLCRGPR